MQKVDDEFTIARMAAMRLCDESGNLLFDVNDVDDLKLINNLSNKVINEILGEEKKAQN
ncbi:hypothetical protein [Taylorella equigenitalis]|uniref:hypothetical protein n=1 Tax=Taylorella equigenitalis TaxID=29575 RepID=UPI0023AFA2F1|nr:hypothetical protein [Taylorella equigenitalis]WEE00122.1 hypothetical protein PZB79_05995 [Taylorella equigenitalis]WEE01599.1 hypothetical protein PZB80_06000 [Taylorella equigenitalis]WFD78136.1 hypothetical protein P7C95_06010 [Taylorella equigenitalis]WFD79614.1 hypothetical protein P7C94_06005 [Taylorella equigenitalis]WFD81090.1 hypothetical protein P7C86_06010 [Taylorella equigenitalis]